MSTTRAHVVDLHTMACVAILVGLLGAASSAQPVYPETPPPPSYTRYRVVLETPHTIFQWQDTAVVVRVQDRQGLPVDGIPVVFQVDPAWTRHTSIRPARAFTQSGRVRTLLRAELLGLVQLTVRVGSVTKRTAIRVMLPLATGYGQDVGCRSQPGEANVLPALLHLSGDCDGPEALRHLVSDAGR